MIKWNNFVEWAFLGLISFFAYQLNSNVTELQKAINQLNTQVASVITDNSLSKELMRDHEQRIRNLEFKIK
jgi:hypothetical protein